MRAMHFILLCAFAISFQPLDMALAQSPTARPATPTEANQRVIAVAIETGDARRIVDDYAALRPLVESVLARENPGAMPTLHAKLDRLFSEDALLPIALAPFGESQRADRVQSQETWAADPLMMEIHGAIRDYEASFEEHGQQRAAPGPRTDLLLRLQHAMHLADWIPQREHWKAKTVAVVVDAIHPGATMEAGLHGSVPALDAAVIIDGWLDPATAAYTDEDLQKYLTFAASEAGQAYMTAYIVAYGTELNGWGAHIASVIGADARKAPGLAPGEDFDTLLEHARTLVNVVRTFASLRESKAVLVKLESADPGNGEVQRLLGEVASSMRRPQPAAGQLRLDDDQISRDMFREADTHFERAIALDPDDALAYTLLGWSRFQQHRDDEASNFFDKARRIGPNTPWLRTNTAALLQTQGRNAEAIALYREVLDHPETVANEHLVAVRNSRAAFEAAGQQAQYNGMVEDYLASHPDAEAVRSAFARHALSTGQDDLATRIIGAGAPAGGENAASALQPQALLLRASKQVDAGGALTSEGRNTFEQAITKAGSAEALVEAACELPSPTVFLELIPRSTDKKAVATQAMLCGILKDDPSLLEGAIVEGADIVTPLPPPFFETPLGAAALFGKLRAFEVLLLAGADRDRPMRDGRPLRKAIEGFNHADAPRMLELLDR